jgi:FtsZ-binding cell division protein ZapB
VQLNKRIDAVTQENKKLRKTLGNYEDRHRTMLEKLGLSKKDIDAALFYLSNRLVNGPPGASIETMRDDNIAEAEYNYEINALPLPRPDRYIENIHVTRIVTLIAHWNRYPITWEAIRIAIAERIFLIDLKKHPKLFTEIWSRQSLSKKKEIAEAFTDRKAYLSAAAKLQNQTPNRKRPIEIVQLKRRIEALALENQEMRKTLGKYEDRHRTLLANLELGAENLEDALEPLSEKVDRRPQDKK